MTVISNKFYHSLDGGRLKARCHQIGHVENSLSCHPAYLHLAGSLKIGSNRGDLRFRQVKRLHGFNEA